MPECSARKSCTWLQRPHAGIGLRTSMKKLASSIPELGGKIRCCAAVAINVTQADDKQTYVKTKIRRTLVLPWSLVLLLPCTTLPSLGVILVTVPKSSTLCRCGHVLWIRLRPNLFPSRKDVLSLLPSRKSGRHSITQLLAALGLVPGSDCLPTFCRAVCLSLYLPVY